MNHKLSLRRRPEEVLREFSRDELKARDEALTEAIALARWVFGHLQAQDEFYIDRMKFGGTTTKNTAIPSFGFDMVVYVTAVHPKNNFSTALPSYLPRILNQFYSTLFSLQADEENGVTDIVKTHRCIQFKVKRYNFDLIPAQSFVEPNAKPNTKSSKPSHDFCTMQSVEILKRVDDIMSLCSPDAVRIISQIYGSSLCENHANFMESQSTFAHDLVRLCKFWNNSLAIEEVIPGREFVISLLAVAAANITGGAFIIQAFHFFLFQLHNFEEIEVEFESEGITSIDYLKHKPIIKDPANPYLNLAENFSDSAKQLFKQYSGEALRRLQEFESNKDHFGGTLEQLFYPQPLKLVMEKVTLQHILVTVEINKFDEPDKPNMEFGRKCSSNPCSIGLQMIGDRINTLVTVNAAWNNLEYFQSTIRDCLERSIPNSNQVTAFGKARDFVKRKFGLEKKFEQEDANVIYVIPYWVGENKKLIVVSLKWMDTV